MSALAQVPPPSSSSTSRMSSSSKSVELTEITEVRRDPSNNTSTTHKYMKGKMLGKGGFAKVYWVQSLDTNKAYAIKIVPKANLVKSRARQKVSSGLSLVPLALCRLHPSHPSCPSPPPKSSPNSSKPRSKYIASSSTGALLNTSTSLRTAQTATSSSSSATTSP